MADDIYSEIVSLKGLTDVLAANQMARFCYTDTAYEDNEASGVTEYAFANEQNIPVKDESYVASSATFLSKGMRANVSSIPRMLFNHLLGRASYNLNKMVDFFSSFMAYYKRDLAQNCNLYSATTLYKIGDTCFFPVTRKISGVTVNTIEFFYRVGNDGVAGAAPIVSGVYNTTVWTLKTNTLSEISSDAMSSTPEANSTKLATSGALYTEKSERTTADTTLQNNINTEKTTREDADTTLQNNINTEKTSRESADNSLSSSISALQEVANFLNAHAITNNNGTATADLRWSVIDSLTTAGVYAVANESNTAKFTMFVFGSETAGSTACVQLAFMFTGDIIFRNKTDGVNWTAWKSILTGISFGSGWYTALGQAIDTTPTSGSTKGITSGAVYTALGNKSFIHAYDDTGSNERSIVDCEGSDVDLRTRENAHNADLVILGSDTEDDIGRIKPISGTFTLGSSRASEVCIQGDIYANNTGVHVYYNSAWHRITATTE